MSFPSFFEQAPTISLYDPLGKFLGSTDDGIMHYSYAEVVKLAGHSCPTVAGAYLMTVKALRKLYGEETPERGAIRVEFCDPQQEGTTGVIANVVSFITGATTDNGFKGLRVQFDRRNLLVFNQMINGLMRFTRLDTGASVTVDFSSAVVPAPAGMMNALLNSLEGSANQEEKQAFAAMWQNRVKEIFERADDPALVILS